MSFLSNVFVDKVLQTTKEVLIKEIVGEINGCGGSFGLSIDSTTDTSLKHQTSIVVRFINMEHKIKESTVAICEQSDSTGHALFLMVKQALDEISLNIANVVGFSFDGAQNMRSDKAGLTHFNTPDKFQQRVCMVLRSSF